MSVSHSHRNPSRARPRAGRQNLARRIDRRSYAPSCVSSHRNCNEKRHQTRAAITNLSIGYDRGQQYSITALTDGGGNVTERYAYSAYGTPTITDATGTTLTSSADNNRYLYTGREYDEALGLYHYRARLYDSISGRFCSRDPIGYLGGINLFAYVSGSPHNKLDPRGTCPCSGTCSYSECIGELDPNAEYTLEMSGACPPGVSASDFLWVSGMPTDAEISEAICSEYESDNPDPDAEFNSCGDDCACEAMPIRQRYAVDRGSLDPDVALEADFRWTDPEVGMEVFGPEIEADDLPVSPSDNRNWRGPCTVTISRDMPINILVTDYEGRCVSATVPLPPNF